MKRKTTPTPQSHTRPQARALRLGDMVVTPEGKVGLLVELSPMAPRGAGVIFVNSGPVHHFGWKSLRHATRAEIIAAGLDGVGCNPPLE